jgi:hypothetical protein
MAPVAPVMAPVAPVVVSVPVTVVVPALAAAMSAALTPYSAMASFICCCVGLPAKNALIL